MKGLAADYRNQRGDILSWFRPEPSGAMVTPTRLVSSETKRDRASEEPQDDADFQLLSSAMAINGFSENRTYRRTAPPMN